MQLFSLLLMQLHGQTFLLTISLCKDPVRITQFQLDYSLHPILKGGFAQIGS